jgi:hypothetical protein
VQKSNLKWVKDLNKTLKDLKLLQENIGKTLEDIEIGNNFLNRDFIQSLPAVHQTIN